jgi:bifunctional oligoribonuclease and PAP phosphatase NrnA
MLVIWIRFLSKLRLKKSKNRYDMKIIDISKLKVLFLNNIRKNNQVGIVTHTKPDGDGVGAALALQEILYGYKVEAEIILEYNLPENYDFLEWENRIKLYSEELSYNNLIILDCHERSRLGKCSTLIDKAKEIIVIDHHLENDIIDSNHYIDPGMVSVGAIIFKMFETEITNLKESSALYIAKVIYVSILNDTENFINTNTDEETFRICSSLMKLGLEPGDITRQFLLNKSAIEMKYIGHILNTIVEYADGRIVFLHSTKSMLKEYGLPGSVNSKILRWAKGLRDVDIVVYFSEMSRGQYKLSLRSDLLDVNLIASRFNGGGHKKASGCSIKGKLSDIKTIVLQEIKKQL